MKHLQCAVELQKSVAPTEAQVNNLIRLGQLIAFRGEPDNAIDFYKQSLTVAEKIGDAQGKATTLHELAGLNAQQGDVDVAIALYQQSLDIKEKIGEAQGKAATLAMLGQFLADANGDTETAIDYLTQSLTILKKVSPPTARTVQGILDRISI